jgi:hypothetical protein
MQLKDFLNSINTSKENLMDTDSKVERLYPSFVVNKCLSYFPDTLLAVNQINAICHADKKMQYDYLMNSIRPKKRFAPWGKKIEDQDVELVMQAFKVSERKALEMVDLLTQEKLEIIRQSQYTGGHK